MSKTLKRVLVLAVALMMLLPLVACAQEEADPAATPTPGPADEATPGTDAEGNQPDDAPAAADPVHLQVLWFSDGDEGITFSRLADRYSEMNPHVTFELMEIPFDDFDGNLRTMIAGGVPPAIARFTNASIGAFVNQLIDLAEYVEAGPAFADNFNAGGLRFLFDGKILGAPKDLTANGLVYNRTAFEQAGVSVPQSVDEIWTWDEWRDAMREVVANSDVTYGLVFDRTTHRFSTLLFQGGASFLNADLTAPNINTQEAADTINFFLELHDEFMPAEVWLGAEDPNSLFRSGQVAMHFAGSWMLANYLDTIDDFEWGFTFLPKQVYRSSVPGGKYLAAIEGSGVEREAALFIEWMSRPEINAEFVLENNFISQVVGNENLPYAFGAEFYAIFASDLAASPPAPGAEWGFPEFTGGINAEFRDRLIDVIGGVLTVEQYLEMMDALFREVLAGIG